MPDIVYDPITKQYYYVNKSNYSQNPYPKINARRWDPRIVAYYNSLYNIRKIPSSPVEDPSFTRTERGYFDLDKGGYPFLPSEQNIFGRTAKNYHEKAWPTRIGILKKDGLFVPHYFRAFEMSAGVKDATSKIISNVICGRLYPTKMPYYIGKLCGKFGTIGIDLNHIEGTKSLRLDKYLESKGIELNSVISFITAYRNGVFNEDLTTSAVMQLMLGMFTLPNAVGEQDPNTRNAILLGPDRKGAKFDSVVRIDFENNRINSDPNNINVTNKPSEAACFYPFGIFNSYENRLEFRDNIIKMLVDKLITPKEATLILSMHKVTEYAAASRTNVDNALCNATTIHQPVDEQGKTNIITKGYFSYNEIQNFAESVITHTTNYANDVEQNFAEASKKAGTVIFTDPHSLPPLEQEQ